MIYCHDMLCYASDCYSYGDNPIFVLILCVLYYCVRLRSHENYSLMFHVSSFVLWRTTVFIIIFNYLRYMQKHFK